MLCFGPVVGGHNANLPPSCGIQDRCSRPAFVRPIDSDTKLEVGLSGPGYRINKRNRLVLESKQEMQKRGEASPDDADALALTWAQRVDPPVVETYMPPQRFGEYSRMG